MQLSRLLVHSKIVLWLFPVQTWVFNSYFTLMLSLKGILMFSLLRLPEHNMKGFKISTPLLCSWLYLNKINISDRNVLLSTWTWRETSHDLNSHLWDTGLPLYLLSYRIHWDWRRVFIEFKCTGYSCNNLKAYPWEDVQCFNPISQSSSEIYMNRNFSW